MKRLADIIRALVRYGDLPHPPTPSPFHGEGVKAYHAISNQIWLWNIALTLAMIPLIGVLFVLYGGLMGAERWNYLIGYISVPVGIAAVQVGLFWWGNRARPYPPTPFPDSGARGAQSVTSPRIGGGREGARTVALHLLILSDCAMIWLFSLLIGAAGGIHFIFPAALALPFYFFRSGIQARAWITKTIWVSVIVGQFVFALIVFHPSPQGGEGLGVGFFPLPPQVTQIARLIIAALVALIAVIWVVYFWWQLGLTRLAVRYYDTISAGGLVSHMTHAEREWQILANRGLYLVVFYLVIIYPPAVLFALLQFIWHKEPKARIMNLLSYFAPTVIIGIFAATGVVIFWHRYRKVISQKAKSGILYLALIFTAVFGYWNAHLYPVSAPFGLLSLASIGGYLLVRDPKKFDGVQFITILLLLFFTTLSIYRQFFSSPIVDLPTYVIAWVSPTVLFLFSILMMFFVYYMRFESDKSKSALEVAHAESEKLLLNILPAEVSHELKAHGHTTPREYPSATVLFTDFVGFTRIAEKLTAVDLVRELDQCFSYFDNVAHKYGLEKLKTIGDAYMAAGGIPVENNTHPIDCALAALEIQAFMNQMKDIKEQQGLPYWELRLGMHTGPLVAGVVGEKKFAYDVWGDTVNTASRMESSGEPGAAKSGA